MTKGTRIVRLIFGILGGIYTAVGGVLLAFAVKAAGSLLQIFTLPEEKIVLAINGTIFSVLGAAFLLVVVILTIAGKRRAQMREELLTWGQRVKAEIVDVYVDHSIRVNGRSPYVARVRCQLPSGEKTLRSHRLWDGRPAVGDMTEVLYDPMNENRYIIEFPAK